MCEGMGLAGLSGAGMEKTAIGRRASETEIDLLELIAPRLGASQVPQDPQDR
jgi:hypothetical protein